MNEAKKELNGPSADSFFLIIVRAVTIVLSLLMTRVLSAHFSLQEYGTYSQIMLMVSTLSSITILGMMDGVNFFFCKEADEDKRNRYISTIFLLQFAANALASMTVLVFSGSIVKYFGNDSLRKLLIFAMSLPVLHNTISLLQIMFIAIGKARLIAIRNLAVSVLKLLFIIISCFVFDSIAVLLLCQVILEVAQIFYFGIPLWKNNCRVSVSRFDKALIKEILTYCIPMAMFVVIKTLNRDSDKFVVSFFTDTETIAVYSNASKLLPFDIVMTSFCTVLLPFITRYVSVRDYNKVRNIYGSFLELSYMSTLILTLGAICVAPELMRFLYTEKYASYDYGVHVFIMYILADAFSVMNVTMVLSAAGKTKTIMIASLGAFVVNIALNIVLFYVFGIIGPALATVLVTVLQGVVFITLTAKEMGTNALHLIDGKYFLKFIFQMVVCVFAVIFIRTIMTICSIHYLIILLLTYGTFCCVMFLLNRSRFLSVLRQINQNKAEN